MYEVKEHFWECVWLVMLLDIAGPSDFECLHQLEQINAEAGQEGFTGSSSPRIDLLTTVVLTACTKQHCLHRGLHSDSWIYIYIFQPQKSYTIARTQKNVMENKIISFWGNS